MDQWEYAIVSFRFDVKRDEQIKKLNDMGKDSWELVSTVVWGDREGIVHHLKRRIVDTRTYRG